MCLTIISLPLSLPQLIILHTLTYLVTVACMMHPVYIYLYIYIFVLCVLITTSHICTKLWLQSAGDTNEMLRNFLAAPKAKNINEPALHPLDLLHRCYISVAVADRVSGPLDSKKWENTMPCAQVLSEAGIDFKKSRTRKFGDVEFKDPVLKGVTKSVVHMPMLRVRHDTERLLLNLMAFERLHPGAGDDVVSYVSFMRNMINNAADVALLRSNAKACLYIRLTVTTRWLSCSTTSTRVS